MLKRRDRAAMLLALECVRGRIAIDDDDGVSAEAPKHEAQS